MMKYVRITAAVLATVLMAAPSFAQRGGCMSQRGGGATGGPTPNAAARNGGGFMANAMMLNQMMAMDRAAQNRFSNPRDTPPPGTNRPRPTPEQFVRAAMRFDGDRNQQLDQTEIGQVANAVIAELQKHQRSVGPNHIQMRAQQQPTSVPKTTDAATDVKSPQEQMAEAFTKKAMTFDADESGTLSIVETRRMATAFIRTL